MTSWTKSRRLRRVAAGFAAIATAAALAACGAPSPGPTDGPTTSPTSAPSGPTSGGSITIVAAGGINSWDPIVTVSPTIPGIQTDPMLAVYGALLYVDGQSIVQPLLAESLETDDFIHWTLNLRPDLVFSDGTPYDAAAVKYNWDRAAGDDSALQGAASKITSEAVDATTLEITLSEANPVFDRQVAEELSYIASPTALEEQGENYTDPVGAGAFLLDEWDPAVGVSFTRNPDYFEEGKPYVDELEFVVIADPAQRVSTVVQGGADIMNNYRFALLDVLDEPGVATTGVESGGVRMFVLNNKTAPFDDVRAREAAALAIDPMELTQTLTQDPDAIGWSGLFPESSNLRAAEHDIASNDIDAAKALVEELKADGVDISVKLLAGAIPELTRAGELLQLQLQEVGFDVTLEPIPLGDWAEAARARHDFDVTLYPGIYDLNNAPISFTNLFEGSENIAQYESAEMAAALETAREATSPEALKDAFATVQEIYARDLPFVVFGIDERLFFHSDAVSGFVPIGRGMLLTHELYRTDQ